MHSNARKKLHLNADDCLSNLNDTQLRMSALTNCMESRNIKSYLKNISEMSTTKQLTAGLQKTKKNKS